MNRILIDDLRERVEIQAATVTRDEFGGEKLAWSTTATVWAKVTERNGREIFAADQPVMLVSYEIVIRADIAINHLNRIVWRSKILNVQSITPLTAEGLIILRCLEADA